jgi:predicted kinase
MPTCILFIGIPASGKSSFFKERFADTHVRVNRDMLRTENRERLLIDACIAGGTDFVVDKTNVLRGERAKVIARARDAGFGVEGYFFQSRKSECIERNRKREGAARIPDIGVGAMSAKLELPSSNEGFDTLYFVRIDNDAFVVEPWNDEVR